MWWCERVESVARAQPSVAGYAVALTDDSSYRRVPAHPRATIDAAFRVHDGVTLAGPGAWAASAGLGMTRGGEKAHVLRGSYPLHWLDYSRGADGPAGTFRYLVVEAR